MLTGLVEQISLQRKFTVKQTITELCSDLLPFDKGLSGLCALP